MKTTFKMLGLLILGTAAAVGIFVRWEIKMDSLDKVSVAHTAQLATMQDKMSDIQLTQHDQIQLLKYIANGRKGSVPIPANGGGGEAPSN